MKLSSNLRDSWKGLWCGQFQFVRVMSSRHRNQVMVVMLELHRLVMLRAYHPSPSPSPRPNHSHSLDMASINLLRCMDTTISINAWYRCVVLHFSSFNPIKHLSLSLPVLCLYFLIRSVFLIIALQIWSNS